VKKLGYTGGLRVTRGNDSAGLLSNDLLVGLHVWPVTDLNSLDEVLQRDDLGELNPLKYYVIRNGNGFGRSTDEADGVVTGRLSIPKAELLSRGLEQTNQAMSQLAASAPTAGDLSPYADNISGGHGSLNQGGAATGSNPDDALPNAQASSGPAAPVQEPEPPAANAPPTYLYDGKTFDQWRDLWKLELNPERRTEAINALAAFGRTGHGQEAADAILAVAGEYPEDYSPTSSEGKLLQAIRLAVARMPAKQWMPQVQARIIAAEQPEKSRWIRHAASFLGATKDSSDEARELAAKFAEIPSDALLTATALYLYRSDQSFEKADTIELMRRALQQKSPGIDVTFLGFRHLDKVPEQLDVLVRVPHARVLLSKRRGTDPAVASRLYPPLLEILKNPDRVSDHVGALRALGSVASVIRNDAASEASLQIMKELVEMLRTAPDEQLPAVLVTYGKYWGSADYRSIINSLEERKQLSPEQAKRLRNLSEQALFEESHAE
jgi:hypothetical protein